MAIPYPEGLPPPMRDSYGFTPTNNIVRTDMQSGRARQRVEFEDVPDMVKLKWTLSEVQSRLFGTWARNVVLGEWCTMPLLTPMGYDTIEVRFTERVDGPTLTGRYHWIWTATCELRETPELDGDWVLLPDYILHSDIFDIAMNKLWPLNEWQVHMDAADYAINEDWPQP